MCAACIDIDAGRFVDLLELDAASNTGIDNMREILDNARYAPTVGRYKVYLIDEVHMLSKAAFNSMLKTLEEPPEHVKFVLATTDPQKIPVTVLSRCLQFNLKPLPPPLIAARLADILDAEDIAFDDGGAGADRARGAAARCATRCRCSTRRSRTAAARCAKPSCARCWARSIASTSIASSMRLLAGDGAALLAEADALAERELVVRRGARRAGVAVPSHRRRAGRAGRRRRAATTPTRIAGYATAFTPDAVQLAYQICVQGRADLALAPDEATGFAMTLLRLLAFEPGARPSAERQAGAFAPPLATRAAHGAARPAPAPPRESVAQPRDRSPARRAAPTAPPSRRPAPRRASAIAARCADRSADWPAFVAALKLSGMAAQLAAQTELKVDRRQRRRRSRCPEAHEHLADKAYADKLKAALDAGDRAQAAAARSRSARRRTPRSRRRRSASAREAKAQDRSGVSRRAVRARRAGALRRDDQDPTRSSRRSAPISVSESDRRLAMMKNQLAGLMKQAQQMQDNMKKAQEELAAIEVEGQSGAGLVKVVMTCRHDVKRVTIDPSLLGEDKDMLEDLVAAAINDAVRRVEADDAGEDGRTDRRACRCRRASSCRSDAA